MIDKLCKDPGFLMNVFETMSTIISPSLIENYPWQGNVRQLINTLEYSAITSKGDSVAGSF
jgi:DNA-binding NtrC family response regulator